ncbi:MAG: polyribonucleotide nucleotidyltransferase [Chlorobi bacterium]|nr:polyribonucleotide nucleotidyltransferase [Chlorobiota bacterium]
MGMGIVRVSCDLGGKEYSIETGRFAKLADGAVMVRYGDTMVLVTVCASPDVRPDVDFLPLTVEYREKSSAAGKIPGSFFRREGRPTEKEILSARLIDRPIRPMFPKGWRADTQIVATVFSADDQNEPNSLGMVGASAALLLSDIPFDGPVSEVHVGRINGRFIVNPTYQELEVSDMEITVAGTDDSIVMVEGTAKEISEDEFLTALEFAHENIRILNALQRELLEKAGGGKRPHRSPQAVECPEELARFIRQQAVEPLYQMIHSSSSKEQRSGFRKRLLDEIILAVQQFVLEHEEFADLPVIQLTSNVVSQVEYELMRQMILDEGRRLDGRIPTDIRPITCEVGLLPRTHGSALFTRGETQSLATITLGTKQDEQIVDGLLPTYERRYMLHYNFPPYSTGEVGRMTGVSRREIGHGNLAERALQPLIPSEEEFPYTIRIVSDILESNGSSSMATVCAGSLACMDAGIPIKKQVAGIAMGLITEGDRVAILSDILGDEDHLGDMDFKVAGTADGITACQMDIKIKGLSLEIVRRALEQAREGRLHILRIMNACIAEPRPELSRYAPRLTTIKIPVEAIGMVIGPGGATIREITRQTNTEINIEEDGTVVIAAVNQENADMAIDWIKGLTREPELGEVYHAKVKEIREGLGAIVEFLPKKLGLLHISQIAHERVNSIIDYLKPGDIVELKLIEIQPDGKFRLSRKALLPPPENGSASQQSTHPEHRQTTSPQRSPAHRGPHRRGGRH